VQVRWRSAGSVAGNVHISAFNYGITAVLGVPIASVTPLDLDTLASDVIIPVTVVGTPLFGVVYHRRVENSLDILVGKPTGPVVRIHSGMVPIDICPQCRGRTVALLQRLQLQNRQPGRLFLLST